ncbi:hypothetical protein NE237_013144 [Protea cynaroides]|uniref:60S ribosomal protein L2, mitochondrial n=1 Tax=Protea cynaroides TaxID=273540 RepID=A0A9Q0GY39_9MAGN|nr:hypothetical protein NE237_013144 [Protea cynaroides]
MITRYTMVVVDQQGRALRQFTFFTGKSAGRNSSGRITVFHQGGGSKRLQRRVDLKQSTSSMGIVERIEYDPNRSSRITPVRWIEWVQLRRQRKCNTIEEFAPPLSSPFSASLSTSTAAPAILASGASFDSYLFGSPSLSSTTALSLIRSSFGAPVLEEFIVVDLEDNQVENTDLPSKKNVLLGLGHRIIDAGDEKNDTIYLSRTSDHVLDVISIAKVLDLVLDVGSIHGDASRMRSGIDLVVLLGSVVASRHLCLVDPISAGALHKEQPVEVT